MTDRVGGRQPFSNRLLAVAAVRMPEATGAHPPVMSKMMLSSDADGTDNSSSRVIERQPAAKHIHPPIRLPTMKSLGVP